MAPTRPAGGPGPLVDDLPPTDTSASWPVWSTTARVVVTDPAALTAARHIVTALLAAVDEVASRFRDDSEVTALARAGGRPVAVSPLLTELVEAALWAARRSDGDVDPTIGGALARLGYDRDVDVIPPDGPAITLRPRPAPGWRRIKLADGPPTGRGVRGHDVAAHRGAMRYLTVPPEVTLDLGASAKAFAADRAARLVHSGLGVGVLVSLGGDIATAGPSPAGGWSVLVQDRPGEPACLVGLPAGAAIATSSTVGRRWRRGGHALHHILDPRTCLPATPAWRTASVVADSCLAANTFATAALVKGPAAPGWLRVAGVPTRLVAADGTVVTGPGWPVTDGLAAGRRA
jgi:thiamine biosynthesis lipoprotein